MKRGDRLLLVHQIRRSIPCREIPFIVFVQRGGPLCYTLPIMQKECRFLTLEKGARLHFMGICGVGMAGLAYLTARSGYRVSGCDSLLNEWAKTLGRAGVDLREGHDAGHVADADCLIITSAIHADNPELLAAREAGIPVLRRGEVLAEIASSRSGVVVCGTHGKTSTSCFTARLFQLLNADPAWCIGGCTQSLGFVSGVGGGGEAPLIVEADESDGTLAFYHPDILVLNNLDVDHLEHFKDVDELHEIFKKAVLQTRTGVVVSRDHPVAWHVAARSRVPVLNFGFSEQADIRAEQVVSTPSGSTFRLVYRGHSADISLPVSGAHNVLNALGAVGAALLKGFPWEGIVKALPLACAELPGRRFETLVEDTSSGVRVVADYAHHPVELEKAVGMARLFKPSRLRVVFQPHRYTRTLAFKSIFPASFREADEVILLPVYPASEDPLPGGGIGDLYAEFRKAGIPTLLARSVGEAYGHLGATLREGDFILIAGAGNVISLARKIEGEWDDIPALIRNALLSPPVQAPSFYRTGRVAPLIESDREEQIIRCVRTLHPRIVGQGSNSWFPDLVTGRRVLRLLPPAEGAVRRISETEVEVSAALPGAALLTWLEREGLGGLSFMDSIPGSVGGWLAMNAGASGGSFGDHVKSIRCLKPEGEIVTIDRDSCGFAYRSCSILREGVALSCILALEPRTRETLADERKEFRSKRLPISGLRCCGSLFRNTPDDPAGRLLDQAGCKGLRVGGAYTTDFHANIVATDEEATSSDILALALIMRNRVREQFGVTLVPEVTGLDFFESV